MMQQACGCALRRRGRGAAAEAGDGQPAHRGHAHQRAVLALALRLHLRCGVADRGRQRHLHPHLSAPPRWPGRCACMQSHTERSHPTNNWHEVSACWVAPSHLRPGDWKSIDWVESPSEASVGLVVLSWIMHHASLALFKHHTTAPPRATLVGSLCKAPTGASQLGFWGGWPL